MKKTNIDLIVYDFDGVMTNNKVIIDQFGKESVVVNRSDGLAISAINKMNIKQVIISTEKNDVVQKRAKKLNIQCLNGVINKLFTLKKYLNDNNISRKNVIYVGNDINDLEAMEYVGFPMAPTDAHEKIIEVAKITIKTRGGDGVIRELLDLILIGKY